MCSSPRAIQLALKSNPQLEVQQVGNQTYEVSLVGSSTRCFEFICKSQKPRVWASVHKCTTVRDWGGETRHARRGIGWRDRRWTTAPGGGGGGGAASAAAAGAPPKQRSPETSAASARAPRPSPMRRFRRRRLEWCGGLAPTEGLGVWRTWPDELLQFGGKGTDQRTVGCVVSAAWIRIQTAGMHSTFLLGDFGVLVWPWLLVEKLKLKQNKNMFSGIFVVQISGHIIESYQIPSGYILLSFLFSLT